MEKNKPVIAFIEPIGGHGGMNYYDFGLCNGLVRAGYDVFLYTSNQTKVDPSIIFPVYLFFTDVFKGRVVARGLRFFYGVLKSLVHAKRKGASIVHAHYFHGSALEFGIALMSRMFGFSLVVTVHDVESFSGGKKGRLPKFCLSLADHLIAHNNVTKNEIVRIFEMDAGRISIIPHGNYIEEKSVLPSKEAARNRLQIDSDVPVVLFFGQIKKVKGLDVLLIAFAQVIKILPNAKLVIAGKVWKDDFSVYQALINELGLAQNILLNIRYIPDEQAKDFYAACDLVALPYKKIYQSGVLLMAMSLGRPVVASDLPGMTEILGTNDDLGYIFATANSDALAEKIVFALMHPVHSARVSGAARSLMKSEFDWNSIGVRTGAVYENLV